MLDRKRLFVFYLNGSCSACEEFELKLFKYISSQNEVFFDYLLPDMKSLNNHSPNFSIDKGVSIEKGAFNVRFLNIIRNI